MGGKNIEMTEPFNFSNLLGQIVKPKLKSCGFKSKGTKFIRKTEIFEEIIYCQRSHFNIPGLPFTFFLNIGFEKGPNKIWGYGRLARPTHIPFPTHYAPFWESKMSSPERNSLMASFSSKQKEEIDLYNHSRQWKYESETELATLFSEAAILLVEVGQKYFNGLNRDIGHETSQADSNMICHRAAVELYNEYISKESRTNPKDHL
jgi:hypothetical protein